MNLIYRMEGLNLDQITRIAKQEGWITGDVWIENRIPRGGLEEWLKKLEKEEAWKMGYLPPMEFVKHALRVLKPGEDVWVIGAGVGSRVRLYIPGRNPSESYAVNLTAEIENKGDTIDVYAKNSEREEIRETIDLRKLGLSGDGFYAFIGTTHYEHVYNADHSEDTYPIYIIGAVAPRLPNKDPKWPWEVVDIYKGSGGIFWKCPHAGLLIYRPSKESNIYILSLWDPIGYWVAKYLDSIRKKQEEERLAELARNYSLERLIKNSVRSVSKL